MSAARSVLILTHQFDPTADLVVEELNRRDVSLFRMDASDFPERLSVGAELANGCWAGVMRTAQRHLDLSSVAGVYYRRPTSFEFHPELTEAERRWSTIQARIGFGGLLATLRPWLNHPHQISRAEYKPVQLSTAAACGLRVPRTLLTNDPEKARAFAADLDRVVYKPFGGSGILDEQGIRQVFCSIVDPQDCANSGIARTMHLFQEWVRKDHEIRLTVVDEHFFAARIDGGSTAAQVDWRADYDSLSYQVVQTPEHIRSQVHDFLRRLDLRTGFRGDA